MHHLHHHPVVEADEIATLIQRSTSAAEAALRRAEQAGITERFGRDRPKWRLLKVVREAVDGPNPQRRRTTEDLMAATVQFAHQAGRPFARHEIETQFTMTERRARQILGALVEQGKLRMEGASTGRSVRYTTTRETHEKK